MRKISINTCVNISNVGTSRRISIYNKSNHNVIRTYHMMLGPVQDHIPIGQDYYNVFTGEVKREPACVQRATRRARLAIIDLARLNKFEYFGTLTLDSKLHNPADVEGTTNKLLSSLKSYQKLADGFKYIIVPEYGEKHHRLHFHFLMKGIREKDLFINENGYLDMSYFKERFGFVQITKIKQTRADIERVSIYIGKYITKDNVQIRCHRYFRSNGLLRVEKTCIESHITARIVRDFLDKFGDSIKYYDKECIAYDVPLPLYEQLRQHVFDTWLVILTHHHRGWLDVIHNMELPK